MEGSSRIKAQASVKRSFMVRIMLVIVVWEEISRINGSWKNRILGSVKDVRWIVWMVVGV